MTYTPSMKQLREDWISLMITSDGYSDAISEEMAEEQWDRAMAVHDAEVAAKAWSEGRESVALDLTRPQDEAGMRTPSRNPYLTTVRTNRGGA